MELALSALREASLILPSEKKVSIVNLSIDSQNGKVAHFVSGEGIFLADHITLQDGVWKCADESPSSAQGESWEKFRVQNHTGNSRGVISELWFDSETFFLTKFESLRTFLKLFPQRRIYGLSDVFDVLPEKKLIIVHEENRTFGGYKLPVRNFEGIPSVGSAQYQKRTP